MLIKMMDHRRRARVSQNVFFGRGTLSFENLAFLCGRPMGPLGGRTGLQFTRLNAHAYIDDLIGYYTRLTRVFRDIHL